MTLWSPVYRIGTSCDGYAWKHDKTEEAELQQLCTHILSTSFKNGRW
jgi:hypothetical protein